uniref:Uncharacterized protein AlNc14C118G6596 n=1 Tax=Albugo laibachii Nc14 TaxID=890382 RepID=F0WJ64_9STRA|nr:conserved hypothetical protein [Albugo laibachii Nc14]|eukprot:CCA21311.1 conserved hypothetical protein [Albugo laibachii Nc14]
MAGVTPFLEDEKEGEIDFDINGLSSQDRQAILSRVKPDTSVPTDASFMFQNDIRRELLDRGIQPKGFFNDDAARLQEAFNEEHEMDREIRMEQKVRAVAINYFKETNQQRRMERENELRQEMLELSQNNRLKVWIQLISDNTTPIYADLRLNSIGTRVLCKNLMLNHSLQALSLNGNGLDDAAGKHIAALLRRNTTLLRLELERNQLGSAAASDIAQALCENDTLLSLSLESNDLTSSEREAAGIAAIASMLAVNSSMKSLNLWRTMLGADGGKHLAAGMLQNDTLLCLEFGCNRIVNLDAVGMHEKLKRNQREFAKLESMETSLQSSLNKAAQNEQARQRTAEERKANMERMEERRQQREKEREVFERERCRQVQVEENRLRQVSTRKALAFAAKLELERKQKKKKGSKKTSKK